MKLYHCSPVRGLQELRAHQPENFEKPCAVYLTSLRSMALMYGIQHFEYTYGYTKEGQIYYSEYWPDAFQTLYSGKSASLYVVDVSDAQATRIPNEYVSASSLAVVEEIEIEDVYEALMEEVKCGNLVLKQYQELNEKQKEWISKANAEVIEKRGLLEKETEEAAYYKAHYPESWERAERKKYETDDL